MLSRFESVSTAVICVICLSYTVSGQMRYLGKQIGDFKTYAHGVKGTVYIASDKTIFIKGFEYDGQGPDAFFWGDVSENPTSSGFIIPNENGSEEVLGKYTGQNLILTLPEGKSTKDIKSFSVWCRRFAVNFGSVIIPTDDLPSEKSLGPLPTLA
ncbi:Protein Skeletor, isoforms D/E, partial [Stegodyphus mimosarum]